MARTAFVTTILTILSGLSWVWLAPTAFGGAVTYAVVTGSSMSPGLAPGDLAVLRRADRLDVGEVAGYRSSTGNAVLHRVVGLEGDRYIFQGDANYWLDTERPTQTDILGRLWFAIPSLGDAVDWARRPVRLAGIAGVLAAMTAHQFRPGERRWPRRSFHRPGDSRGSMLQLAAAGAPGRVGLGLCAALSFAAAAVVAYAFITPATRERVDRAPYEHHGAFAYRAESLVPTQPPAGVADDELRARLSAPELRRLVEVPVTTGQPLLLNVNPNFDFEFRYQLEPGAIRNPRGTVSLYVVIRDVTGWERRYSLAPDSEFRGQTFAVTVSGISVRSFVDTVALYQALTGHTPRYYTATVHADVKVEGTVDGRAYTEIFRPRLVMRIVPPVEVYPETDDTRTFEIPGNQRSPTAIDPFTHVLRGEARVLSVEPMTVPLFRWQLPLQYLRAAGLALLGLALCGIAGILFLTRRAAQRGEAFLIRAQYGPSLVLVDRDARGHDRSRFMRVSTMDDLARLAQHNGAPILVELHDGRLTYLVREGEHFYSYEGEFEDRRVPS